MDWALAIDVHSITDPLIMESEEFKKNLQFTVHYRTWDWKSDGTFSTTDDILPMHYCTESDWEDQGFA